MKKPGVEILIFRTFFTNEKLLKFLSSNTANIFMYDKMVGRGISSIIDYAISANVPIVISDSFMFRHIYSDEICIYKNSLVDCMNNSKLILPTLLSRYSNKNLIEKVDNIIYDTYILNGVSVQESVSLKNYKVEVSIGEIVDKYSILDLKTKYIKDETKLIEINKEMKTLGESVDVKKYPYFYKLLLHINELIWLDTDIIKGLVFDSLDYSDIVKFAETSNRIFENNQKRFRLKSYFNILQQSNVKEQKSYNQTICFIKISNEEEIYNKIPELNYLFISYDVVYICVDYAEIINKIFINPNIKFVSSLYPDDNSPNDNSTNKIEYNISSFSISDDIITVYEYEPIRYISAGRLGDFLNQLSVVCEKFYETGRRGILYIVDKEFAYPVQHTYIDTLDTILNQKYIKNYHIYNGEPFDINLSSWRNNFNYLENFKVVFNVNYNIDWARHCWLTGKFDSKWANKNIIYITPYRFLSENSFQRLKTVINKDFVFITMNKADYNYFITHTGFSIDCYIMNSFDELVTIINSCKLAYFGMTSFAVIANALKKPQILLGMPGPDYNLNKFLGILPNIVDEFI
jgi:hypothetical protein